MTISQASAVNIVWDYLAGHQSPGGMRRTPDDVADAMRTLAGPAYKALQAGVSPDRISADQIPVPAEVEEPGVGVKLVDGVLLHCAACDATDFKYEESHPSERTLASNKGGRLTFYGDFEWFDGDDDPGVVCAECGAIIGPIEWEVEFS